MTLTVRNVPAFEKEDYMPPEWDFRAGFLVIPDNRGTPKKDNGRIQFARQRRVSLHEQKGRIEERGRSFDRRGQTDDEKLQRLYRFCQNEIGNLKIVGHGEVKAEREKPPMTNGIGFRNPRTPGESDGWTNEINNLFAGMAQLAGFEVKRVDNASRANILNIKTRRLIFLNRLQSRCGWRHLAILRQGLLVPYECSSNDEGVTALLCDKDK